jgi:hypothetical protein
MSEGNVKIKIGIRLNKLKVGYFEELEASSSLA